MTGASPSLSSKQGFTLPWSVTAKGGFTLIELLIVVAIIAILAVIVVITLNPAQLIKQSRDSTRLQDIGTINRVLGIYQSDGGTSLGTSSIVYVSIPDPAATTTQGSDCAALGFPTLPSGWAYHCAASSTYRKVNGLGWIPVNFTQISFGNPLPNLPVDPINTTSTRKYYTYVTGGSWELAARLESEKYVPNAGIDGGPDPALYERGTDLSLAPFLGGMVGWWKFDETGTTANDSSGYGNNWTMYSSTTITDIHISADCKSGSCGSFDGTDDYVDLGNSSNLSFDSGTVSFWFVNKGTGKTGYVLARGPDVDQWQNFAIVFETLSTGLNVSANAEHQLVIPYSSLKNGDFLTFVFDYPKVYFYLNGVLNNTLTFTSHFNIGSQYHTVLGKCGEKNLWYFDGTIDEVRIYNRALSAAEITAIYNATK